MSDVLTRPVETCTVCGRSEPIHASRRGFTPYADAMSRLARRCEAAGHESRPVLSNEEER